MLHWRHKSESNGVGFMCLFFGSWYLSDYQQTHEQMVFYHDKRYQFIPYSFLSGIASLVYLILCSLDENKVITQQPNTIASKR